MQHTTRSTAHKLHSAGFPQPEPAAGQHWWHPDYSEPILCAGPSENPGEYSMVMPGPRIESQGAEFFARALFSPTAMDILRELGGMFTIHFDCGEFWCGEEKDFNPAEAAALAWINLKEIATT